MNFSDSKNAPLAFERVEEMIGNTPLVRLRRSLEKMPVGKWLREQLPDIGEGAVKSALYAKIESMNPGGSVKDRIAFHMVNEAEKSGALKAGGTLVEATSGNTGAGLALMAALRGYKAIFCMPDKMSAEKINALRAFGAKVVVCPSTVEPDHPEYYVNRAKSISEEIQGAYLANQYFNMDNPDAHYLSTGPEIWHQMGGKIDAFICGIGTGGTISGTAKYLKEKNPAIKIIAVDPEGSIYYDLIRTGKFDKARPYLVEGIGEDMVPDTMNLKITDAVIPTEDKPSFAATRMLAQKEGLLVGGSCGAAFFGACQWLRFHESQGGAPLRAVLLLPDSGSRYLSKVFNDSWLNSKEVMDTWNGEELGGEVEYTSQAKPVNGV